MKVTPLPLYLRRREFLARGAGSVVGAAAVSFGTDERQTPYEDVTHYNNYYEFGTDKSDPAANAGAFPTRPWTVAFEGEIKHPQSVDVDQLLKWFPLEERIYRMRCVEAWSMVIPWAGFPLAELIRRLEPTPRAKYVAFTSRLDPSRMPDSGAACWSGPTSRACASTRPPTR